MPKKTNTSRVTQLGIEIIRNSRNKTNITQLAIETASKSLNNISHITQLVIETAYKTAPASKVTQLAIETAYPASSPPSVPVGSRSTGTYQSVILAETGLQSYWKLNETTGTTATDSKGTNTGTYNGGFTLNQTGPLPLTTGTAVTFNGTTGYISTANIVNYSNYTYELWFKCTAFPSSTGLLVGLIDNTAGTFAHDLYISNTGIINFQYWDTGQHVISSFNPISLNTWYHIAVTTASNSIVNMYLDGILIASGPIGITGQINFTHPNFRMGSGTGLGYGYFPGTIDEVALYNVALSQSAILNHLSSLGTSPYSVSTQLGIELIRDSSTIISYTTQLGIEIVRDSHNQSNISQLGIEVVRDSLNQSNITQLSLETAYKTALASLVTQLIIETAYSNPTPSTAPSNQALTSQIGVETISIVLPTPGFTMIGSPFIKPIFPRLQ